MLVLALVGANYDAVDAEYVHKFPFRQKPYFVGGHFVFCFFLLFLTVTIHS